jgi:flap endonuclease-1
MGIKNLNRFLLDNCNKKSITKIHLSKLTGKKLVIDVSIYLYKFLSENALMENMYLFISILKKYDISPIFIFDGKPPPEKKQLLIKRLIDKMEAEKKYLNIKEDLLLETNEEKKEEKIVEMELLKKQFIRVKDDDVCKVKQLFDAYGVSYFVAPSEADQLCAYLNKIEQVWGCVSDDMDMFLYGCNYVIRHISLLNHTAVLYDRNKILADLNMSSQIFNEIMILSGTDYNINNETSLNETVKWYYEYMKYSEKEIKNNKQPYSFYVWLIKHTKYIKNYKLLLRTYQLFQLEKNDCLDNYKTEKNVININFEKLYNVMEKEGFLFVK